MDYKSHYSFLQFKRDNLLTQRQYEELKEKLNKQNDLDLYKLQQNLRIQKVMSFEEKRLRTGFLYEYPECFWLGFTFLNSSFVSSSFGLMLEFDFWNLYLSFLT